MGISNFPSVPKTGINTNTNASNFTTQAQISRKEGEPLPEAPLGFEYVKEDVQLNDGVVSYVLKAIEVTPDAISPNQATVFEGAKGTSLPEGVSNAQQSGVNPKTAEFLSKVGATGLDLAQTVAKQAVQSVVEGEQAPIATSPDGFVGNHLQDALNKTLDGESLVQTTIDKTSTIERKQEATASTKASDSTCFTDLSVEQKQDRSEVLQFLATNRESLTEEQYNELLGGFGGDQEVVMTALDKANKSPGLLFDLGNLDSALLDKPDFRQAAFKKLHQKLQQTELGDLLTRAKGESGTEKAASVQQIQYSGSQSLKKVWAMGIDGTKTDSLVSGRKDALITESEVVATLLKLTGKNEPTRDDITKFSELRDVYRYLQQDGLEVRIAGSAKNQVESTPVKDFDEARLQQLEVALGKASSDFVNMSSKQAIQEMNETHAEHAAIPDELELAIRAYTGPLFRVLNHALRSGEISEEQQLMIDGVSEGLRQMPSHKGIVWRGASLPREVLAQYIPGQEIVEKAFTSTSYGEQPAFHGSVMYCIQLKDEGSAGKKIDEFSAIKEEKEVLINAGTRFKVLAKEETMRKVFGRRKPVRDKTIIYLQEM